LKNYNAEYGGKTGGGTEEKKDEHSDIIAKKINESKKDIPPPIPKAEVE